MIRYDLNKQDIRNLTRSLHAANVRDFNSFLQSKLGDIYLIIKKAILLEQYEKPEGCYLSENLSYLNEKDMLDTLYKKLTDEGIPDPQAEIILKPAVYFIETMKHIYGKEYQELLKALRGLELTEYRAKLVAEVIKAEFFKALDKE